MIGLHMKVSELFSGVWIGSPLKLRDLYSAADLKDVMDKPATAQTVTLKNAQTGEVVGYRTIYQK